MFNLLLNVFLQYFFHFRFYFAKYPRQKIALVLLFFVSVFAMLINVGLNKFLSWQLFATYNVYFQILVDFYLLNILFFIADKIGYKFSSLLISNVINKNTQKVKEPEFTKYYLIKWFSLIWITIAYWVLVLLHITIMFILSFYKII